MLLDFREILPQQPAGDALQAVYQSRNGQLRRIVNQQVNVVWLAIELDQGHAKILADLTGVTLHRDQVFMLKNVLPVFRREHQVRMKQENDMPAASVLC